MRPLIVIPARLESTRLPRKLLLAEAGKPLIQHVIEQAAASTVPDEMMVACPNEDYAELVGPVHSTAYNCCDSERLYRWPPVVCTSDHPNGTSRAAHVASFADQVNERPHGWWDAYCIVQADYPEIPPALIDKVVSELEQHPEWDCATAATANHGLGINLWSTSKVKVWPDPVDRIAIDFGRDTASQPRQLDCAFKATGGRLPEPELHIGIYAYRREALLKYAAAGPCEREVSESLEQLRALHIGLKMGVVLWDQPVHGIDTREDYDAFVARHKASVDESKAGR